MKSANFFRPCLISVLAGVLLLSMWPSPAAPAAYTRTQVTGKMALGGFLSPLNKQGHIAWGETDYTPTEVYKTMFYRYGVIECLYSTTEQPAFSLGINDADQVVWSNLEHGFNNIYLYSGGATNKIAASTLTTEYSTPSLNNQGDIHLLEHDIATDRTRLTISQNGVTKYASPYYWGFDGTYYAINNQVQAVWPVRHDYNLPFQIIFYDGTNTSQVTNDTEYSNFAPKINDRGDIIWGRHSTGHRNELILDRDGIFTTVTTDLYDYAYALNNLGEIAWIGVDGNLYFFRNGVNTVIAQADYSNGPYLNDRSQILYFILGAQKYVLYDFPSGAKTEFPVAVAGSMRSLNDRGQLVGILAPGYPDPYQSIMLFSPVNITPANNLLLGE